MTARTSSPRTSEIKTRVTEDVKEKATDVFSQWGLSLSDAINVFLIKSIEMNGFPFRVRREPAPTTLNYAALSSIAYKAPLNEEGVPILPAEWADDE